MKSSSSEKQPSAAKPAGILFKVLFPLGLVVIIAAAAAATAGYLKKKNPQYNVLLVTMDTTRADRLGCYGYTEGETPHIDALAVGGSRFEQAYSVVPLTLPSHISLMTGLYPPEHGVRVNGTHRLAPEVPTLASSFKEHGYQTAAFIAAFVLDKRFGLNTGFDLYDDYKVPESKDAYQNNMYKYRRGDEVADSAMAWLKGNSSKPFFCWVHFYDPHRPYHYKKNPYDKEITFMDKQIGRLTKCLREQGVLKNTIIILAADHGEGLGEHNEDEHGLLLQQPVMRIPLIMAHPGKLPAGKVVDTPVSLVDIAPTVHELLGWKTKAAVSGRSFAPALTGGTLKAHPLYMETEFPFTEYGWSPLAGVVRDEWKYILSPKEELYNVAADPAETNNTLSAAGDTAEEMRGELDLVKKAMVVREHTKVKLDKEAEEALESLGYIGGGGSSETNGILRDVKDVIGLRRDFITSIGMEERKEFGEAATLLRTMMEKSPETFMFQYKLATMLYREGKFKDACEEYELVAKKYPDQYKPHYTFGTALIKIGKFERAVDELKLAMKLDSRQLPCYNNLAIALLKSGETFEAMEFFKESIELKHDQTEPHNNLGTIYLSMGKLPEAEKEFRTSIDVDEEYVDGHYNLGLCLLAQNRTKEAAQFFEKTLILNPDHQNAKAKLEQALQGKSKPLAARPKDASADKK